MNHARQNEVCDRCGRKPILSRRKDGLNWRAIYWCTTCCKAAFGGDSFVRVAPEHLDALPVIDTTSKQGDLF